MPTLRTVQCSGRRLSRRVDEAGGLRELSRLLWVAPDLLFPFYLAILIQTSGNPMAIADLERNCIRPHPIRDDLERLVWEKRRAKKEQRCEFPATREWSAPNLVRRLRLINDGLVDHAPPKDKNRLFIAMLPTRRAGRPCFQLFHILLDQFIVRHGLPGFDFRDLRRAGAVAHHKASGKMDTARSRLNHASVRTTGRYTDPSDLRDQHERVIRRFQGEIVKWSSQLAGQANVSERKKSVGTPAATVFGFECRDPTGGINSEVPRGTLCTHFQRCATCPGAVIPLDDVEVVARLLSASKALQGARDRSLKEGWWPRFEYHYEPTRRILEEEILPSVTTSIRELANESMTAQAIVWLE